MATPEALIAAATARGANVQRKPGAAPGVGRYNREGDWKPAPAAAPSAPPAETPAAAHSPAPGKPAWQTLRERGIAGQGSAAANKAMAAGLGPEMPPPLGEEPMVNATNAAEGEPGPGASPTHAFRPLRVGPPESGPAPVPAEGPSVIGPFRGLRLGSLLRTDTGGSPMQIPPGQGMTKPLFRPAGLLPGVPTEPAQGGEEADQPVPWEGLAALMQARLSGLGGLRPQGRDWQRGQGYGESGIPLPTGNGAGTFGY